MCLVKPLLEKIQWKKNLVKEKEYTSLTIRIYVASLKTLQGKSSGTKPRKGKRVQRVLTLPNKNTLGPLHLDLVHHLLKSCN